MYLMSWSSFVIVIMAYTFQFFFFELCILFCAHYLFVYLFDGIKKEKSVYFINEPLLIQSYMSVLRMYIEYLFTLERYIACCMHILPYTEWHAMVTASNVDRRTSTPWVLQPIFLHSYIKKNSFCIMLHYHKKSRKMLHIRTSTTGVLAEGELVEPFLHSWRSNHWRTIHSVKNLQKKLTYITAATWE